MTLFQGRSQSARLKLKLRSLILATALVFILPAVNEVEAQPIVIIQNDSMWFNSFLGWLYVVGEVKNTASLWVVGPNIEIKGVLRDEGGGMVGMESTRVELANIPPGETAPFEIWESDSAKASKTRSYSLQIVGPVLLANITITPKLLVQNIAETKGTEGLREVAGYVKNLGTAVSRLTRVVGTFYNDTGKVVYVQSRLTDPGDIAPGSTSSFRLPVHEEQSQKITGYKLAAESSEYTSVPELHWPVLAAGSVLLLAIFAVRTRTQRIKSGV